jgi:hypothetical protein
MKIAVSSASNQRSSSELDSARRLLVQQTRIKSRKLVPPQCARGYINYATCSELLFYVLMQRQRDAAYKRARSRRVTLFRRRFTNKEARACAVERAMFACLLDTI